MSDEKAREDMDMMEMIEGVWERCTKRQQDALSDGEFLGRVGGPDGLAEFLEAEGLSGEEG
jgi:hypothetical protein